MLKLSLPLAPNFAIVETFGCSFCFSCCVASKTKTGVVVHLLAFPKVAHTILLDQLFSLLLPSIFSP